MRQACLVWWSTRQQAYLCDTCFNREGHNKMQWEWRSLVHVCRSQPPTALITITGRPRQTKKNKPNMHHEACTWLSLGGEVEPVTGKDAGGLRRFRNRSPLSEPDPPYHEALWGSPRLRVTNLRILFYSHSLFSLREVSTSKTFSIFTSVEIFSHCLWTGTLVKCLIQLCS